MWKRLKNKCSKRLVVCLILFMPGVSRSQPNKTWTVSLQDTEYQKGSNKPELLSCGFFDVMNNGQLNASARFIRMWIGEPGKFSIPVSVYSGVSSNNLQPVNQMNGQLVNNLINPLSGLTNISIDGILLRSKQQHQLTESRIIYQFGERLLTGNRETWLTNSASASLVNFTNTYVVVGIYLQTGAWERNNIKYPGICWMSFRFISSRSGPAQLRQIFQNFHTNGMYHGYSIGWGIDINRLVNIKVIYYNFLKAPDTGYSRPIYLCSFQYALK